jgi:hypothetical protein
MSKHSKSDLTAFRKRKARAADPLDILDAFNARCAHIRMVARLLEASHDPVLLDERLAADVGYFIEEELEQARKLLRQL